jgi:ribulose-phosphate 3-epimerase
MTWHEWIRTVEIEPAVSAADPLRLESQIETLVRSGCRLLHLDIADGEYDLIDMLAPIARRYGGVLDVHLAPDASVREAATRGADSVTVEAGTQDAEAASFVAREHGCQFGVLFPPVLGPDWFPIDPAAVDLVSLEVTDLDASLARIRSVADGLPATMVLQVQGEVTHENVKLLHDAGANVFVVGRALFEREDLPRTYRRLVQALA